MKLREIITEAVINDNMFQLGNDLEVIRESLIRQMIMEGLHDPGILKCVFMAGGPASGKGFISSSIFGIDKGFKASFSATGLKVVNSDTAFEALLKKHGIDSKDLDRIEKEDPELWDKISNNPSSIRNQAKSITKKQQAFYEEGRLGLIIDGTGKDLAKIKKQKETAESKGYDTYMIFVDTSLEVAKKNNQERDRVVPEDILVQSWKECQENKAKFSRLFGGNFAIVDNNEKKPVEKQIVQASNKFVKEPIQNPIGKKWVETAKAMYKANLIK